MNKKLNILFCTGLFPPAIGGPAKIAAKLFSELPQRDFTCSVITYRSSDNVMPAGVTAIDMAQAQPGRFLTLLVKTFKLARQHDVLYVFDNYSHGLCAALASRLLRKPMIIRFTGDSAWEKSFNNGAITDDITTFQTKFYSLKIWWQKKLRTFIVKSARQIITDCQFLKNLLIQIGRPAAKITVINNAVDFWSEPTDKANIPPNILTLSRLVPWKGVAALIKIMPAVREKFPNAILKIVGDGPEENSLKNLTQNLGLEKSVIFLGKISGKEAKIKLYQDAAIVALNTLYEGMSNTLAESLAAGCAVITTRAGGNPEFATSDNSILVEYNNEEQIKTAIIDLLSHPAKARGLGAKAFQSARQYTWENLINRNIDVIAREGIPDRGNPDSAPEIIASKNTVQRDVKIASSASTPPRNDKSQF